MSTQIREKERNHKLKLGREESASNASASSLNALIF